MNKPLSIYLASGWFNDRDDRILTSLEDFLYNFKGVSVYRPRKDGVELKSNDFHDHTKRKEVFDSNVDHIDSADLLVVNLDCGSERLDTGTVWECARAVVSGIPVIIYNESSMTTLEDRLGTLLTGSVGITHVSNIIGLEHVLRSYLDLGTIRYPGVRRFDSRRKVPYLILDRENQETDLTVTCLDLIKSLYVMNPHNTPTSTMMESYIFEKASYLILPTDSKDPVITWYMSAAYYLGIPVLTYSDKGNPLNLMLIFSVMKHIVGVEDLRETLSLVTRQGLSSLPTFNTESVKVY